MMLERFTDLTDKRRAELQEERIRLAQLRDGLPTWEELAVMVEVWEEFGL